MADRLGMIQIYTGDGKGKTTAAIGLTVRAAGHGFVCRIIQFMKGSSVSGENRALSAFANIKIDRIGLNMIGPNPPTREEVAASLRPAMTAAVEAINGDYQLVVLDEIITACSLGLVGEAEILSLLEKKNNQVEVILTGRGASPALIDKADLVTEMRLIKHPFDKGQAARLGIEF